MTDRINKLGDAYVSTTVIGELYYGAYSPLNPQKHIEQIADFLSDCIIVSPGHEASKIYGELKADLKRKGTPIPENYIWIAATALEQRLSLFTTDNHFEMLDIDLFED